MNKKETAYFMFFLYLSKHLVECNFVNINKIQL